MPVRISAWAIYDVFETAREGEQLFVGVVSDGQWVTFCQAFGLDALGANPDYAVNNQRVLAREVILPQVRALFGAMERAELVATLERIGLPFAPITRPDELFDDPHLNAGGLVDVTLADGTATKLPTLPLELDGERMQAGRDIPRIGEDTDRLLERAGYSGADIARVKISKAPDSGQRQ